ncbi:TonB-dependent receptor [Holophaga foetida]|uniref:TonB-dependent receptor n=1 Tax=Holophaga foetida TaxID=35839 RepID=UPI0002472157|nr:TonB-dependent receptor [Holophaga foetida]
MSSFPWKQAACSLLSAATLSAQSTGTTTADLRGQVRWAGSSAPSELRLLFKARGTRWRVVPDAQGTFIFHLLPPGAYELEVWSAGNVRLHLPDIQLHAGNTHELSLLVPPPAQAQVSVEDTLGSTGNGRTQAAWVVDSQLLTELPINRRNFADLSLVTPLATTARGPINSGAPDSGLSFAGAGPRQNNFMVDGLDNNDLGNGSSRLLMSQEAIQEFQVITNGYAAEFGRATGGVVNAVTRSGSNQTEGTLFYYLRPGALDAKSPLSGSSSSLRMHQYGASASGPILKDRLFYYVCVEGLRRSDENQVTIDPAVAAAIRSAGFDLQTGSQRTTEESLSLLAKLDYLQSSESRWGLRLLHSDQRSDDRIPWGGLRARSVGGRQDLRDTALTLTQQWIPNATLIRETKLMYTTRRNDLRALDDDRTVQVDIQGVASFGTQRLTPQATRTTYLQLVDTTTKVLGDHTLKAGIDWLNTYNRGSVENNYAGYYLFQALPGLPPQYYPFQNGYFPVAFVQAFGDPFTSFRTDNQSAFLQDEWRPRQDLLLRFGVRYDRERIPAFTDTADYQALGNTVGAYSELFKTQRDWTSSRWSPRFSFSWQAAQAWRFFGGFGSFMGQTNLSPIFGIRTTNGSQGYGILLTALDTNTPYQAWLNPDHRYTSDPGGLPRSLVIPGSHEAPMSRQLNLGVEWKPRPDLTLTLDILRSQGSHLMNMRDVNPYVNLTQRINPAYSSIYRIDDSGASRYSGQGLTVDWRPSSRARFQASYCHSQAEDNVTDWATSLAPQNPLDPDTEWGASSQDQRHRILVSAVLSSGDAGGPWRRNWTLGLQVSMGSGRPYTQLAGLDLNLNGDGSSDRPAGVGRNSENLPWSRRVDLRISRGFAWATVQGEASLDVFNLFNHANVTEVQNTLNSDTPAYGTPTDYEAMRQVQCGVRFKY